MSMQSHKAYEVEVIPQVERRQFLVGTVGSGLLAALASLSSERSARAQDSLEPTLQSAATPADLISEWQGLLDQSVVELKKSIGALNPLTLKDLTKAASETLTRFDDLLNAILREQEDRGLAANLRFSRALTEIAVQFVREVSDFLNSGVVKIFGQSLGTQTSDSLEELFAVNDSLLGRILAIVSKDMRLWLEPREDPS
jgi:hypothetical protein